jgi:hypothetical protein
VTQNLPATQQDDLYTGLEDFGVEDAVIPRLQIVHKEGLFKDNLNGSTFPKVRLIVLGMAKQRIMWHPTVDDNDKPMCRSADFETGFPTISDVPKEKLFPWHLSGFDPSHFPPDEDGQVQLPCASCKLKEWNTHPNGKTPYCSEQWTMPVQYDGFNPETGEYSGVYSLALLSLQKSSLKAIRSYLTSFSRPPVQPAFTAVCEATLTLKSRGQVDYSEPSFRIVGKTDPANYQEYSMQARDLRNYLRRAPEPVEVDADNSMPPNPASNVNQPPTQGNVVQGETVQNQSQGQPDPWAQAQAQTESNPPVQPNPAQPAPQQPVEQPAQPAPQQSTGLPF